MHCVKKTKTWILCSVRFGIEDTPSLHNMSKKYIVMAHRKSFSDIRQGIDN